MHMIRKGQVRWLAKGDIAEQVASSNSSSGSVSDRRIQAQPVSGLAAPICNRAVLRTLLQLGPTSA
jgi:hypothetical protein